MKAQVSISAYFPNSSGCPMAERGVVLDWADATATAADVVGADSVSATVETGSARAN